MPTDWITTDEATQLTGYNLDHLRELLRDGKIIGKKWRREWQVSRSSLLAYVRNMAKLGAKRGPRRGD